MPVAAPPKISLPFGYAAAPSYIQNPIPITSVDPERADYQSGFKPLSMTPVIAGGKPPWGQDVNGILYACTANAAFLTAGQLYRYDSEVAGLIGGYAKGCILGAADGAGTWLNLVDGNTSDPDGASVNWVPMFSYGQANLSMTGQGGAVIAPPSAYRQRVILLSGTLGANVTLQLPVNTLQTWLIVNGTSGGFSLSVQGVGGGNAVPIPPGGYGAPVGVYSSGGEIFPTVAPLGYVIDQAPTPLSLVQRTNNGYVLANYFQQASPYENIATSGVWFESASDGYHRKMTLANFAALMLSSMAPDVVRATNGYLNLPGGILIQWGVQQFGDLASGAYANTRNVTFPKAFALGVPPFAVLASPLNDATGGTAFTRFTNANGFQLVMEEYAGRAQGSNCSAAWFAVGLGV